MTAATLRPLRLYEATDALDVVREWLYEHDDEIRAMEGVIPDELAALLHEAEGDFKTKVERVALFIRELIANAGSFKVEEERLHLRRKHYEKAAEGLKGYLLHEMQRADIPKIEGRLITVRLQKSPPSVRVSLDQESLGRMTEELSTALYVVTVPESFRVDAEYVKAVWKNGKPLPEGIAVEQGLHLRIA